MNNLSAYQDPKFYSRMGVNSGSNIVLNKRFLHWESFIKDCLEGRGFYDISSACNKFSKKNPEREDIIVYHAEPLKNIHKECNIHASQHNIPLKDNVLILMHPTFMFQQGMEYISDDEKSEQADAYWENLTNTMHDRKSEISLMIADSIQHYAAATSLWLEHGKIDAAVFTEYNCGRLKAPGFLESLHGKTVFVGGMYNYFCVTTLISQLRQHKDIDWYAVKDLVVNQPSQCEQLRPTEIWQGIMDIAPKDRLISLERLLR